MKVTHLYHSGCLVELDNHLLLFDYYQGEHITKGFKSLAYTLVYQDKNATLKDEVVSYEFNKAITKLQEELEVTVR